MKGREELIINAYANQVKRRILHDSWLIEKCTINVPRDALKDYWYKLTLREMELIFTLFDQNILGILLQQYLRIFWKPDRLEPETSYTIKSDPKTNLLSIYDCKRLKKMFNNSNKFVKEIVSAFILIFKWCEYEENSFDFGDCSYLPANAWSLKVKQNSIFKFYDHLERKREEGDEVILLPVDRYTHFLEAMMLSTRCRINSPESLYSFFDIIASLLENQLYTAYVRTLSEMQVMHLKYNSPVKTIDKPRIKEESTMIEDRYQYIHWQAFRVPLYRLMYSVVETENSYVCYREPENEEVPTFPPIILNPDTDINIIEAFKKAQWTCY